MLSEVDYGKYFYHLQGLLVKKDKYFFHGHDRFAEEREKLWETQQQAADYFGVSRVTWGQCERGNATPSGDVLAGLAQRGADVLYILTGQRSQAVPEAATLGTQQRALLNSFEMCTPEAQKQLLQLAALLAAGLPAGSGSVTQTIHAPVIGGVAGGSIYKGK